MDFFTCVQNQIPESDGNCETTLEKEETNPLNVPLDDIAENLLSFLNGIKSLCEAKKVIEKKYEIKKEQGDCWPADDIKRAWGQTQRMDIKSKRRRYWTHVIILQMLKRFMVYDACKPNAAQEDHDDAVNDINQSCEIRPGMKENSEHASSQSNDDLQKRTVGLHAFKHKLTEKSSAISESQLSDVGIATSPAELREKISYAHSNSSESMNAALVNENDNTLDNNCELQKSIDNCEELNFTDMPNRMKAERENGGGEDDLWSTVDVNQACGKAESMKRNSEDRSSQSSAALETVEAAGGDRQSSGANHKSTKSGLNQTNSVSKNQSGTQLPARSQATKKDTGVSADQFGINASAASESEKADETIYIRIPFSAMFSSESKSSQRVSPKKSKYKLINGCPSDTGLKIRKSYAMSFDPATNNAEWVYEILNRETLVNNCDQISFGDGYVKGHLAAAANHSWCREAYNDANLFSNMIPQNSELNNSRWKALENRCRIMANNNEICNVHVYTGPLYQRPMYQFVFDGRRKIVPTHLFKVIIVENKDGTVEKPECYVIPNEEPQANNLNVSKVDITYIQRRSRLNFIEDRPNKDMRDYMKLVRLQGEGGNGEPREVNISFRISS